MESFAKLHDQVNVVRHHNKAVQIVTFTIKIQQRIGNDTGEFRASENALAVTLIEAALPASRAHTAVLGLEFAGNDSRAGNSPVSTSPSWTVVAKPLCDLVVPALNHIARHRIRGAERHESSDADLEPVRKMTR